MLTGLSHDPQDAETEISALLEGLSDYRRAVYDGLNEVDPAAAWRYARCGSDFVGLFAYCPDCEQASPDFYAKPITTSCMLRICPDCADLLAAPIRDRYRPVIEHVFANMKPGWSLKHITLTRSVGLDEDTGGIARAIMDQAMEWCEQMILKHDGAGVIATEEVGETGQKYHVHIIAYSPFIRQGDMSRAWEAITGDPVVWARRFESADEAIREGLKYVTKFTALSPDQLVQLHTALKGTRRIRSRGCFYMGQHNPLRDLIDHEQHVCNCPQCGSPVAIAGALEFGLLISMRPWLLSLSLTDAADQTRRNARFLHSTEAIKWGSDPP